MSVFSGPRTRRGDLTHTSLINDANLVAYWKFDGDSIDSKGSYDGSDSGVTYSPTAKFFKSAYFDVVQGNNGGNGKSGIVIIRYKMN